MLKRLVARIGQWFIGRAVMEEFRRMGLQRMDPNGLYHLHTTGEPDAGMRRCIEAFKEQRAPEASFLITADPVRLERIDPDSVYILDSAAPKDVVALFCKEWNRLRAEGKVGQLIVIDHRVLHTKAHHLADPSNMVDICDQLEENAL